MLPGDAQSPLGTIDVVTSRKAWWLYSLLRIGMFAAAFGVVWLLGARSWLAVVLAAIIALALSLLLLNDLRQRASDGLHEWRTRERTEDDIVEDDLIDGTSTPEAER